MRVQLFRCLKVGPANLTPSTLSILAVVLVFDPPHIGASPIIVRAL